VGGGPSERIISIAKAVQEHAFGWEPDARLIGNVCAEDVADLCGAILLQQLSAPAPGMRREYLWSPPQMAECGGPCWEARDPRCCDCGALWRDVPIRLDEGQTQRGNGNGGPTTPKPPIGPQPHGGRLITNNEPHEDI
jgi:hypothetical protein